MNNWRRDNPCSYGDEFDHSNHQKTSSGKVKGTGERFSLNGSNNLRLKIKSPSYRQYKSGDFLAIRPLTWEELIDADNDDMNWVDPGAPGSGRSRPSHRNDNDDCEGDEDTQCHGIWTGKEKGTKDGKGQGKGKEKGKGKAMEEGKRKGNGNGKELLYKPQGERISLVLLLCSCRRKCTRQSRTQRANWSGYIHSRKYCPPGEFRQMIIPTLPSRMVNMTEKLILLWICSWRMMRTHRMAMI
jgi:hypothetical protein